MARVNVVTSKANGFLGLIYTVRLDLNFKDFKDNGFTQTTNLYKLPFGAQYLDCWAEVTEPFGGGTIQTYTISAGRGNGLESSILAANDVMQTGLLTLPDHKGLDLKTPGKTNLYSTNDITELYATAICEGDTLKHATTGKISIYLVISQAPSSDE